MPRLYNVILLFNFYAEYIMRNAGLEEAQAGTKISALEEVKNVKTGCSHPINKSRGIVLGD